MLDDEFGNDDENEKEFEPTVDMIMNEFDDERTIEEEESGEEEPEEGKDYSWKKTIMIGPSYQVAKNTNTEHFFLPGLRIHAFLNALPHAAYYIRPAILSPLNAITTATSLWLPNSYSKPLRTHIFILGTSLI